MDVILRRMNFGNIHLCELEVALRTGDCRRAIDAAASLHETWTSVETMLAILHRRASRRDARSSERWHHDVARNALMASRYFARDSLTRMWGLLRDDARRRTARGGESHPLSGMRASSA
jgi:hypothetical protein